jgi:transcriptional regulator with XRE-family HTH domain
MKERIQEFLRIENKSSSQFAEEIGVQPSAISHIISGRNKPSLDFILKMLAKYPTLSTDWILFGKGTMYREDASDLFSAANFDALGEVADREKENDASNLVRDEVVKDVTNKTNRPSDLISADKRKASRIVFFFDDNTFSEYIQG